MRLRTCDGGVSSGKRGGSYYLNKKGYLFIRPRMIAYIEEHKPIAIRGDQSPITIEQIDKIFQDWWLSVIGNTQKELDKAKAKVEAIKAAMAAILE